MAIHDEHLNPAASLPAENSLNNTDGNASAAEFSEPGDNDSTDLSPESTSLAVTEEHPASPATDQTTDAATEQDTPLPQPEPKKPGLLKKVGAGIAGAAFLVGGGAFMLKGGDSDSTSKSRDVSTEEMGKLLNEADPKLPVSSTATTPEVNGSEKFNPARILPGDKTMEISLIDGTKVEIPLLRDPDKDVMAFAESFWAMYSGYMSTADESVLSKMTQNPNIKDFLREQYDEVSKQYADNAGKFEISVLAKEGSAVDFVKKAGGSVELQGTLRLILTSSNEWQTRKNGYGLPEYDIKTAEVSYEKAADGTVYITHFKYTAGNAE